MTPLRISVAFHAVSSSFTRVISSSAIEHLSSDLLDFHSHPDEIKYVELYVATLALAYKGYQLYTLSPLQKLTVFPEYVLAQKITQCIILFLLAILFRNVENAI